MELLDQYLEAVKRHLPWQGQDDILAELRSNLESQVEDKEALLGRPMTKAEVETWLKELGTPIQMAARYKPQQYLIGPGIFPVYWYVLRMVLLWTLAIFVVVNAVQIAFSNSNMAQLGLTLLHTPWVLLISAALVTLVFAILERAAMHNPELLAKVNVGISEWKLAGPFDAPVCHKKTSKAKVIADVVFKTVLLVWLLLLPHYPSLLWGPGAHYLMSLPYKFAPVVMQFYWWIIGLNTLQLVLTAVVLARGNWQQTHRARKLVESAVGLLPLGWLLTASGHVYFLLKNAALAKPGQVTQLATVNHSLYMALWLAWFVVLATFLWKAGQAALDARRRSMASR